MAWNPFKKLEKQEAKPGSVDLALEELSKGERIESNIQTLRNQLQTNPDLFEGREDEVIKILVGIKAEDIGNMLDKLTEMKEKKLGLEDETREMPALKISKGLEKLIEAKQDFQKIGEDFDDLAGFMGAVRQMAENESYFSDPEFTNRLIKTVDTISDAVYTWSDEAEKKELQKRFNRLINTMPAIVREQIAEEVA